MKEVYYTRLAIISTQRHYKIDVDKKTYEITTKMPDLRSVQNIHY